MKEKIRGTSQLEDLTRKGTPHVDYSGSVKGKEEGILRKFFSLLPAGQ